MDIDELATALGVSARTVRRDDCGDWRIFGRYGTILTTPEGAYLYFRGADEFCEPPAGSSAWAHARKALSFAKVVNDGDGEGVLFLTDMPTPDQAGAIRDKFGIRKRKSVSEETLARLSSIRPTKPLLTVPETASNEAAA